MNQNNNAKTMDLNNNIIMSYYINSSMSFKMKHIKITRLKVKD